MNHNMQDGQRFEILKLKEENQELKSKLARLNQKADQPLAMTTFSPVRDNQQNNENHLSLTDTKLQESGLPVYNLNEIGRRLINLMKKLGISTISFSQDDSSIAALKDMIYEI